VTGPLTFPERSRPAAAAPTPARPARVAIGTVTAAVVALHVLVALISPYEFHRDEFLYMAMGRNLSLFAMDFPPMIALLAEAQRGLLGDALWALRLAPALAHGALVLLTALLAWRLGGGWFAQALAMTAVATGPLFLRAGSLFQPVVFDQLWWTLALYALVRLAADDVAAARVPREGGASDRALRHWILFGGACGIGLLTKFSILLFGAGVFAALLLSRRPWLRTPGPWLAAGLALVIGAPSWIGQIALEFPIITQMSALREAQLDRIGYGQFLTELVLMQGPAAFLLAVAGAAALLALRRPARWRVVGLACLITFLIIMALRGKPYYAMPVFPTLFAAGAVLCGRAILRVAAPVPRRAARIAALVLVGVWGPALLPLSLPLFPPESTARFAAAIGHTPTSNRGVALELPQDYADMLGWESKVAQVAAVYHTLPPQDREDAVIVATNYGQAGAIDFYGARYGLPGAEAPVGSYWFWGPGEKPGRVIVKVGGTAADLDGYCSTITLAARIDEPWLVPEERDLAVWICRDPPGTLQEVWPLFRGRH
jgi:4-amino-4-deoxy-L-arabinose transferase-like glycosyltransferase